MGQYTARCLTPICKMAASKNRLLEGTGTFIKLLGEIHLLTCEHVAKIRLGQPLTYFTDAGQEAAAMRSPFFCASPPVDAAVARLDDRRRQVFAKNPIPVSAFDRTFGAEVGEILFVHGYPYPKSQFFQSFGNRFVGKSVPYTTCQRPLPDGFDDRVHVALHYPREGTVDEEGNPVDLPRPGGLSGSLLWDTKMVGAEVPFWSPQLAKVCGIVIAWCEDDELLIATRIEHVNQMLLVHARHEAAYFRHIDPSEPDRGPLEDWLYAEGAIGEIGP